MIKRLHRKHERHRASEGRQHDALVGARLASGGKYNLEGVAQDYGRHGRGLSSTERVWHR